jgi:hypothetical protein
MGKHDQQIEDIQRRRAHEKEMESRSSHLSLPSSIISITTTAYANAEKIEKNIAKYQANLATRFSNVANRSFCTYHRVFTHADSSQPNVQVWRPIIDGVLTEQWHLSSFSQPLVKHKYATLVRSMHAFPMEIPLSIHHDTHNPNSPSQSFVSMLEFLGYRFDYEYVKIGYVFPLYERSVHAVERALEKSQSDESDVLRNERRIDEERRVEVTVYSLLRLEKRDDLSSIEPIRGMKWIVEVSGYGEEDQLPRIQERVLSIARSLSPLMKFSKLPP